MVGQGRFLNTGIQVPILNYAATLSSYLKSHSSQAKSPVTGKNGVSHLFLKKGDEDCRSYQPVSLTSVPGKIMVQIIPKDTSKHMEDGEVVKDSQHELQLLQGQTVPD